MLLRRREKVGIMLDIFPLHHTLNMMGILIVVEEMFKKCDGTVAG